MYLHRLKVRVEDEVVHKEEVVLQRQRIILLLRPQLELML